MSLNIVIFLVFKPAQCNYTPVGEHVIVVLMSSFKQEMIVGNLLCVLC